MFIAATKSYWTALISLKGRYYKHVYPLLNVMAIALKLLLNEKTESNSIIVDILQETQ
jgi:hypothetical protein